MSKKHFEDKLRELFSKKQVLDIKDVYKTLKTKSRVTAYRYLQGLGALSSYSQAGKYYTLKEIPQFDKEGLWHHGEINFSKHGTLMKTIEYLVEASESGKSCSELEKQLRVYVQNALLALVTTKKLSRQVVDGIYVYVSCDPNQSDLQIKNRYLQEKVVPLPGWVIMEVLTATIKCLSGHVTAEEVALQLKKQGSSVTLDEVKRVFKLHSLEKKTQDSSP